MKKILMTLTLTLMLILSCTSVYADGYVPTDTIYPGQGYELTDEQLHILTAMCMAENGEAGLRVEASQMANLYEYEHGLASSYEYTEPVASTTPTPEPIIAETGEHIVCIAEGIGNPEISTLKSAFPEMRFERYEDQETTAEAVEWSPEYAVRDILRHSDTPTSVLFWCRGTEYSGAVEEGANMLSFDGRVKDIRVVMPEQDAERMLLHLKKDIVTLPENDYVTLSLKDYYTNDANANSDADTNTNVNTDTTDTSINTDTVDGTALYEYIDYGGWYATGASHGHGGAYYEYYNNMRQEWLDAVRDVLTGGNRVLPQYVVEHDAIGDVTWKSTDEWIPNVTRYSNSSGASNIVFYGFPNGLEDPFGYYG